ncbi:MAG TPA: efflux RND transporter permease subunit [Opitutaceae bacterium]
MNFSEIFIRRPVATILLAVAAAGFGISAYFKLPVSDLPNIEFPSISVSANYPGASPETMVSTITTPLERELALTQGVTTIRSNSGVGTCSINLSFSSDRKINDVAMDVQAAINRAAPVLPRDLPSPPTYQKGSSNAAPIMYLTLTSSVLTEPQLYDFAKNDVVDTLTQVQDVAQVLILGTKTAYWVDADPRKVAAAGFTLADLKTAIEQANNSQPAGSIPGKFSTFAITPDGALQTAPQIEHIMVHNSNGDALRLSDLANVRSWVQNRNFHVRYVNGGKVITDPSLVLAVYRLPGKNTVAIADRIKMRMKGIRTELPSSIKLDVLFDQSLPIVESIDDVKLTLVIAFVLVVMVVALFLGRIRDTVIPSVAIPFTLALTFVLMNWLGYSLDNLSMMALVLSIGFVVDDAIVVLEDTVRRMEHEGMSAFAAALASSKQIGPTIISVTLSLAAIFLPLYFMSGTIGLLFREFAVTIIATIFLSALVAIVVTPVMCARMLKGPRGHSHRNGFEKMFDRAFQPICDLNAAVLSWCLRHRWVSVVAWILFFVGTIDLTTKTLGAFIPTGDSGAIYGALVTRAGASGDVLERQQDQIANAFVTTPAVDRGIVVNGFGPSGIVFASLKPHGQRPYIDNVVQDLRNKLSGMLGGQVYLNPLPVLIPGDSGGEGGYSYTLMSADKDALYKYSNLLRDQVAADPEFVDVHTNISLDSPGVYFQVKQQEASALGLSPGQVQQYVSLAFSDNQITSVKTPTSQYLVMLDVADKYRGDPSLLSDLKMPTPGGPMVPLGEVVDWGYRGSAASVDRVNQLTAITLNYNVKPGADVGAAQAKLTKLADSLLPTVVKHGVIDASADSAAASSSLLGLLVLAVVVMYLVLGILYESFIHPITVLSSLPVAAYGGVLTLVLFGSKLNLFGFIGLFLLLGLVKKNGIMMIDFALHYRRENPRATAAEAALEASKVRFRPILMTTLAAALGAMPIALGIGAGGDSRQPLGLVVVGGLILAQVITIFITPVIYVLLDPIDAWIRRRQASAEEVVPAHVPARS